MTAEADGICLHWRVSALVRLQSTGILWLELGNEINDPLSNEQLTFIIEGRGLLFLMGVGQKNTL